MSIKKGLGRGFESLIPTDLLDESFDPTASQDEQISELRQIKLTQIVADPDQPRRQFDDDSLEDLASSIREHGILQPIIVMPFGDGYQIVAGERRFRASGLAGLDKIPALVRTLSGQHKLELSLIENLQRRDLNVLETATAYQKLRDQFNLTLEQIGQRVGNKSVSAISNTLRLLRLPESVRAPLANGTLREGQVRPLIGLDDKLISAILPQIIKEEWSARRIEQYIVDLKKNSASTAPKSLRQPVIATRSYDNELKKMTEKLSTDVTIRSNTKGAGQIVIKFKDDKDLQRIQDLLS